VARSCALDSADSLGHIHELMSGIFLHLNANWHSDKGHFTIDVKNVGPMFHLSWTQAEAGQNAIAPDFLERDIMPGNTRISLASDLLISTSDFRSFMKIE